MAAVNMADMMGKATTKSTTSSGSSGGNGSGKANPAAILKPIPQVARLLMMRLKLLGPQEMTSLVASVTQDSSNAFIKLLPELAPIIKQVATMNPKDVNTANVQGQDGMPGQQQGQQPQQAPTPGQ